MLVGVQLRKLREASGVTRDEAADAIRGSHSKISRLELGRVGFKRRDVVDLLALYGHTDEADCATLLALAEQANLPGWWHAYSDVVPAWFEPYLGLEQGARVIRAYQVQFFPGLLQTEEYARAVIRLSHEDSSADRIERSVSLRMHRQQLLHRPNPPHLWAVVDEAALRRPIGGTATMRAQIEHLLHISELPHVTIQLMPFSAGGHIAAGGPITILRLREPALPDVVYLEQLASAVYPDKSSDIARYQHVMNRLVTEAEPPAETTKSLRRALKGS